MRVAMGVGKDFVRRPIGHSVRDDYPWASVGKSRAAVKLA
jgi:hypothetical protein